MASVRARRWLGRVAAALITLLVLLVVAATWVYSEQIEDSLLTVGVAPRVYDLQVLAVGDGRVTLSPGAGAEAPGVWGLEWETGYARVGPVTGVTAAGVTRPLLAKAGYLRPGLAARLDVLAYESDPADAGLDYRPVIVEGPLGNYPAWRTEGTDDTWVLLVHGSHSSRRQALRALPTLAAAGFPTLTITYRNDPGAPSAGGRSGLGDPEWEDLAAAVEYALDQGAEDVVLMGYGTGGTTAVIFLRESESASAVVGLVLDAPVLDAGAVIDAHARAHNVPGFILGWAKGLATLRFGVDWGGLSQVGPDARFGVPILLFHGEADAEVPVEASDRFAALHTGLVRYVRTPGAGHAASWNVDPAGYEAALTAFLEEVAAGPAPRPGFGPAPEPGV
jgi:alpha-beta hydrolase superfamily lysophospholipase